MRPRDFSPYRKRHGPQFIAIEQQLLRQRLEAILHREPAKELEVFRGPQVFAVQPQLLEARGPNHRSAVSRPHLAAREAPGD